MISRRALLGTSAAIPAALAAASKPRLLGQVYVFTQELARRKIPLADGLDEIFSTTGDAGFHGIELMSQLFTPELRDRTIASAKKHGIDVPITYSGGRMHTADAADKTIESVLTLAEVAAPAGTAAINLNPDPIGRAKSDDELSIQADKLNRLGEALAKRRQKLFIHSHAPEMANNAREWRHILNHTDPALVSICLDTHWVYRGGQDWMMLAREAGKRIGSIHLRNSVAGVWSETLGPGDLQYEQLSAFLKREKLTPYLEVELAYEAGTPRTRTLSENLRLGREYAERVFGVKA